MLLQFAVPSDRELRKVRKILLHSVRMAHGHINSIECIAYCSLIFYYFSFGGTNDYLLQQFLSSRLTKYYIVTALANSNTIYQRNTQNQSQLKQVFLGFSQSAIKDSITLLKK